MFQKKNYNTDPLAAESSPIINSLFRASLKSGLFICFIFLAIKQLSNRAELEKSYKGFSCKLII